MKEYLKKDLEKFDISFKEISKEDLTIQVGMQGAAYITYVKKGKERVEALQGKVINGSYGKSAIQLFTLDYPLTEENLENFKGGVLLFLNQITEKHFSGNLYKVETVSLNISSI